MKNTECRGAQDQLVEYIEGELDKTQQALLARHLETCADCQKELKEIERLRAALHRCLGLFGCGSAKPVAGLDS